MKIANINMVDYGSAGTIMALISENAQKIRIEMKTFSKECRRQRKKENNIFFGYMLPDYVYGKVC